MAIESVLAGMAQNMAEDGYKSALQYFNQKRLQKMASADYRRNLEYSQNLNLESQRRGIEQSTSALRSAGLSPVLAAGSMTTAVPAASAPMSAGSAGMPTGSSAAMVEAINDARAFENQQKLVESETHRNESEAREIDIKNAHSDSQDKALNEGLYQMLDEMRNSTDNPFMRGFLDNYLDANNSNLDLGVYDAFNRLWFELPQRERDRELDYIQKEFDKKVLALQYENNAAAALADMPRAKRFEVYAAINQMNANIARLNAETSLTEDQRDNLRASTSKLAQEVQSIFHSDPAALYKAGDISSLLVSLGFDAVKAGAAGAGFSLGAAATRGAGVAGAAAKTAAPAVAKSVAPAASRQLSQSLVNQIRASINRNFPNATPQYKAALFNKAVERARKSQK